MLSSAVRTFTDPDDYTAAIRASIIELTITARGQFAAKLTRIDLDRLWLQRFSENLPYAAHTLNDKGRAIVSFRTRAGANMLRGGMEMQTTSIVRHGNGQSYFRVSSGSACYASMSLPVEEMVAVGEAMAGFDLTPPRDATVITPRPSAMAKL